jgi:phosphate transport system substrate-binding protein
LLVGCGDGGGGPATNGPGGSGGPTTGAAGTGTATEKLSGEVVIEGSSTVYRISQAAQIGFKKAQPDVRVKLAGKGTGTGFGRYLRGETDVIDASRPAKPEEEAEAKEKGLEWTRFLVGYDGITLVVPKSNEFVKVLTVEQLKALFEPDSQVATWKQLDTSWPDRKIKLFTPDNDSGTFEFFAEAIVGKKAQRKDGVQTSADDNTLVTGVARDPDALGYFGYAYYVKNKSILRDVAVQAGPDAPAVEPNPTTILDGTYKPLSRPLYIYVKNEALKARPEVVAFVRYYLEQIDDLTTRADYVPPTAEDKQANQAAFAAATGANGSS